MSNQESTLQVGWWYGIRREETYQCGKEVCSNTKSVAKNRINKMEVGSVWPVPTNRGAKVRKALQKQWKDFGETEDGAGSVGRTRIQSRVLWGIQRSCSIDERFRLPTNPNGINNNGRLVIEFASEMDLHCLNPLKSQGTREDWVTYHMSIAFLI